MSKILIIEIKKYLVLIFTSTYKVPSEKLTFLSKLITIKAEIGITILEFFIFEILLPFSDRAISNRYYNMKSVLDDN
jgi:flagellar biosynthesis protein FliQ